MAGWGTLGSIMIGPGFPTNDFGDIITQYANNAVWNTQAKTIPVRGQPARAGGAY